ncbi:MAG: ABC transporter ATP-binding protein [Treponema sp.]|nr:ABC transporter ATP-binding protein [Treponema sp.]
MLEIRNLYCGYGGGDVIRDISLKAGRGEILCIAGPNGCGKTTLLKAIAHILGYRGSISVDSREVSSFSRRALARKIAVMSQGQEIYFPFTVADTVALGRYAHSEKYIPSLSRKDRDLVAEALEKLGLSGGKDSMINELSGGQLQRVFLARTLVQDPEIILLDEPTNHLDLKYQVELLRGLTDWVRENNRTVIAVLHDLNLARSFADTIALMRDGELAAGGSPAAVLGRETLKSVYGMDVHSFMLQSLSAWQTETAPPARTGQDYRHA